MNDRSTLFVSKAKLSGFLLFGLLPYTVLFGASIVAYGVLFAYLALQLRVRNLAALIVTGAGCVFFVARGPFTGHGITVEYLNAVNTTIGFFFLALSPWIRFDARLEESKLTDFAVIGFLFLSLLQISAQPSIAAGLQIASFTFALYFALSRDLFRRTLVALMVAIGGGRAILAGGLYGLLMARRRRVHAVVTGFALIAVAALLLTGALLLYAQDYLLFLKGEGLNMKGRTGFWLTLLKLEPSLLGAGAGAAVENLMTVTERFHLPHNDYLRVYVDYGVVALLALLFALWRNSLRGPNQLFATSVLALYMLTGNPLSFATVIVTYLVTMNGTMVGRSANRKWIPLIENPDGAQLLRLGRAKR